MLHKEIQHYYNENRHYSPRQDIEDLLRKKNERKKKPFLSFVSQARLYPLRVLSSFYN